MKALEKEHSTHREIELLDALKALGGAARTTNLADTMDVSEETVRRTVKALAKAKLVKRVHGGVYLADADATNTIFSRMDINPSEKNKIGSLAAKAIPDRSTVFLDVGSTTTFVAESLKHHLGLTIVTNGMNIAYTLATQNNKRIFFCGGEIRNVEFGAFGPDALKFVEKFGIDTAVISVDGIDAVNGFLHAGSEESELSRAVTARARQVIVAADDSKFGQLAPFVACEPDKVNLLVTNTTPPPLFCDKFVQWGIDLQIADKEA